MALRDVRKRIGSGIGMCLQFACANPMISLELFSVGVIAAIYPQFCMRVFMSPVVIYTAMLLTVFLRIGHHQQQEKLSRKKKAIDTHNEADSAEADHDADSINEVSEVTMKFGEQTLTEDLSTEKPMSEGKIWDIVEMEDHDEDSFHGKSVPREIVITEEGLMYRSHLDVIMEDIEGESGTPLKQTTDDDDDEDDDGSYIDPSEDGSYIDPSEDGDLEDRGKVPLEDFFSHTLQSSWKTFHNSNSSDMESSSESSVDHDSLGDLGPLVYQIHDQSDEFGELSRGQQKMDEEELRDENLFEIVHEGDVHSVSEDDNLIEIALSDHQEIINSSEEAVKRIDPGFTERKADNDQIQMGVNSSHSQEGNLIEIDLSVAADNLDVRQKMESDDDHKTPNLAEFTLEEETQYSKQAELSSSSEKHGEIHQPETTEIGDVATPPPSRPPLGSEGI